MSFPRLLELEAEQTQEERQAELENMEFQVLRMRENIKEISKKYDIVGIDQTKQDNWVIVFKDADDEKGQLMVNDCAGPFKGHWDSCMQLEFKDEQTVHIADIKGPEDQGYGSILMNYLKDLVKEFNYQYITGDLVERDWDHLNRLTYFYEKHNFNVNVDPNQQKGEIIWHGDL
ncbi:hypothetical protein [Piscibacillus salipiscarius]|uniref:N-acetyltransferase domain-containing protein n=1 Tax=Piscibacillus salipiscarius TaxID=299480 RepID=A0ABW5QBD0_9BACI|nr:hypothetical protein [Piscibacillus salipiscarius]